MKQAKKYALYLDDERFPKTTREFVIARSYKDAVYIVEHNGLPSYVSFDHDLGSDIETGYTFTKYLVDYMLQNNITEMFEWNVHSANPVGAKNIDQYLENFAHYLSQEGNNSCS